MCAESRKLSQNLNVAYCDVPIAWSCLSVSVTPVVSRLSIICLEEPLPLARKVCCKSVIAWSVSWTRLRSPAWFPWQPCSAACLEASDEQWHQHTHYVAVRSYRRQPSPNSLLILAMNAMRIYMSPSRIVTSPARDSGLLHSICCALRYMAKSPVTRKWGCPSFSATSTNFSKVVYIVEMYVGGACMKGRYLIVVTVLPDVMALKPFHAGMVCVTLLANHAIPSLCYDGLVYWQQGGSGHGRWFWNLLWLGMPFWHRTIMLWHIARTRRSGTSASLVVVTFW